MDDRSPAERARANATGIVSTLVTGIWMAALFTGQEWWLAALLVGYVVVVPITAMLFGDEEDVEEWWNDAGEWTGDGAESTDTEAAGRAGGDGGAGGGDETALERLRRRYAEGELTDEQFERKLERLLETETLEDVEERRWARDRERELSGDRGEETDVEPETERS